MYLYKNNEIVQFMTPRIELLPQKTFVGMRRKMSFATMNPYVLWSTFMPRKHEIPLIVGADLYSMEVYPSGFFNSFSPVVEFDKWAAVEVSETQDVPDGMEIIEVPEGWYAVFVHYGPASEAKKTYDYIFRTWLPASDYLLDERPHFAVMGAKYRQNDPESEEEIWIPVRKK